MAVTNTHANGGQNYPFSSVEATVPADRDRIVNLTTRVHQGEISVTSLTLREARVLRDFLSVAIALLDLRDMKALDEHNAALRSLPLGRKPVQES
jgi:hypothetical protein